MSGPGLSLFQGAELRLNQTDPDEEEAEHAEEEERRKAELGQLLNGAFDDLQLNDGDLSFASSKNLNQQSMPALDSCSDEDSLQVTPKKLVNGHQNGHLPNGHGDETPLSGHYQHCYHNKGGYASTADSSPRKVTNGGDAEHLATLYGVRMREIGRLQDVLETTRHEADERAQRLGQKILELEAERAAMKNSQTQTQQLLVEAKVEVSNLLRQVDELRKQNTDLEHLKDELEHDGVIMRANIDSLNSKLIALEKISHETSGARQADLIIKSLQDRHSKEIVSYQVQIQQLKDKLAESVENVKTQERRVGELTRNHEMSLLERADAINRLSRALAESQQHCQELMASDNSGAKREIQSLKTTVKKLETEVEQYKADIDQLETMVGMSILTSSSTAPADAAKFYKTGLDSVEGLRDELAKSLRYHEARRAEIKQLKFNLQEKEAALKRTQEELDNLNDKCAKQTDELGKKSTASDRDIQLKQENEILKEKISTLEEAIVRFEEQNTQLAESSVELQRAYEEEKLKIIDDHSRQYLKFHSEEVGRARQEEREKLNREFEKLRLELGLALKDADESKQAYINLVTTKNAVANELDNQRKIMDKLQSQIGGVTKQDLGDLQISIYEERVRREIEMAKREMLEEVAKEKELLTRTAKMEAEKDFARRIDEAIHNAKVEWQKSEMQKNSRLSPLQAEIQKLQAQLEEEREEAKRQKKQMEEKLWSHFHEELMRVDRQHNELRSKADIDKLGGETLVNGNVSIRKTHSLSNLDTRSELEERLQQVTQELEQTKNTHSKRLMELQELLFTKQKEMEEFKQRLVDYTKNQIEEKDRQSEQYIQALKKEVDCLNKELSKLSSIGLHGPDKLKSEKHKIEEEKLKLMKLVDQFKDKESRAKEFYERREEMIRQEFKRKEEGYYKVLLRLKEEVDSFSLLDCLPKSGNAEKPVRL